MFFFVPKDIFVGQSIEAVDASQGDVDFDQSLSASLEDLELVLVEDFEDFLKSVFLDNHQSCVPLGFDSEVSGAIIEHFQVSEVRAFAIRLEANIFANHTVDFAFYNQEDL